MAFEAAADARVLPPEVVEVVVPFFVVDFVVTPSFVVVVVVVVPFLVVVVVVVPSLVVSWWSCRRWSWCPSIRGSA